MVPAHDPASPFHAQAAQAALQGLGSGLSGLDLQEAQARKTQVGPNHLPRAGRESAWALLGRQIHNPLIYVLLGAAALAGAALVQPRLVLGLGARAWAGWQAYRRVQPIARTLLRQLM